MGKGPDTMKLRKTTITAMLVLALLAACGGGDNPGGSPDSGTDSGTGGNTATTAGSGYN
jgi:ABC-type glycerol-3-phosphate transport system substrate-binding protein